MQNQSSWRTQTSLRGDRDVFHLSLNYFKAKWHKNKTLWIQTWDIFIFGERTLRSCCEVLTVSSLALIFLSLPHLNTPSVLSFMLLYSSVVFLRISRVWGGSPVLSQRIRELPERLWRCNSRWNLRNYSANAGLAPRLSNPLVWHCFSLSRFKSLTLSAKAEAPLNSSKPVNHLKWRRVVLVFLHCLLASRYYCCCRYLKTSWDRHRNLIRNYHRKIVSSPSNLEELNSGVEWVFRKGRERERGASLPWMHFAINKISFSSY